MKKIIVILILLFVAITFAQNNSNPVVKPESKTSEESKPKKEKKIKSNKKEVIKQEETAPVKKEEQKQPAEIPVKKDAKFIPITEKTAVIELSNSDTILYRTVNIAIGEAFVMEFPKGIILSDKPVVGESSLLRIELNNEPLTVSVWGLLYANTTEAGMYTLNTNMQFKLNCGITIIINFVIQPPDIASNRIVFKYKEWEEAQDGVKKSLEILKNKLQLEYEEKKKLLDEEAESKMIELLARNFSEFYQCNNYSSREEQELVFLASDRICNIGKNYIMLNFKIKNRYRQRFHIDSVKVYTGNGTDKNEVSNAFYFLDKYSMQFDEVINGAAAFKIDNDEYSKEYTIELTEAAGKKRVIKLTVSF